MGTPFGKWGPCALGVTKSITGVSPGSYIPIANIPVYNIKSNKLVAINCHRYSRATPRNKDDLHRSPIPSRQSLTLMKIIIKLDKLAYTVESTAPCSDDLGKTMCSDIYNQHAR